MPTVNNIALAIYISNTGKILATESLGGGSREIAVNQLDSSGTTTDSALLNVEVRVGLVQKGGGGGAGGELMALRTCYDMSGRKVPCF